MMRYPLVFDLTRSIWIVASLLGLLPCYRAGVLPEMVMYVAENTHVQVIGMVIVLCTPNPTGEWCCGLPCCARERPEAASIALSIPHLARGAIGVISPVSVRDVWQLWVGHQG
jgi:hypothetical protein